MGWTRGWSLALIVSLGALAAACGSDESGARESGDGGDASGTPTRSGNRFDSEDRDAAARWWSGLVGELVEARASGNALRVDAARKRIAEQTAPLAGQRVRYLFNVWTNRPISAEGVFVTVNHRAGPALLRVGAARSADGRDAPKGAPLLLRPGSGLESDVLARLSAKSTFVLSARIDEARFVDGMWASGFKQYADPPILLLVVSDLAIEDVRP
jgi:hypothetical protein